MLERTDNPRYFSGPLNLSRDTKRADTVMGTQLLLDDRKFDALDMLVSSDGESLPFEQLYESVWGDPDNPVSHDEARLELKDLIEQVNTAGEGFMKIEHNPETGYSFVTHWGHNWQSQVSSEDTFDMPDGFMTIPSAPKKTDRRLLAGLITGAVAAAVVIVVVLTSVMSELSPGVDIIDESPPLALPDKFIISICLDEGGCGNPDECTGEGICDETEAAGLGWGLPNLTVESDEDEEPGEDRKPEDETESDDDEESEDDEEPEDDEESDD